MTYIVSYLSLKYNVSERKVYDIVSHLSERLLKLYKYTIFY